MKYIEASGLKIPKLGLGTCNLLGAVCTRQIEYALDIGYRLIDTAQYYNNEAEVGQAVKNSAVKREDIIITTKIWPTDFEHAPFLKAVDQSLKTLQQDYIDLLLLHWPSAKVPLQNTLQALLEVQKSGKVLHIGVSNFNPDLLQQTTAYCGKNLIVNNQVEYHCFLNQADILKFVRANGMFLTAYCPLARGQVVAEPVLKKIAQTHGKTPVQVALRWLIEQDAVLAIPQSKQPTRIKSFLDIFDFSLTATETKQINQLQTAAGRIVPLITI